MVRSVCQSDFARGLIDRMADSWWSVTDWVP